MNSRILTRDNNGNLIITFTFILIVIILIVGVLILSSSIYMYNEKTNSISSSNFQYQIEDYKRNIPTITYESLNETIIDIIKDKKELKNSRLYLKGRINEKLDNLNDVYYRNYGLIIDSEVTSIENTNDNPFTIKVSTSLSIKKNNDSYNSNDVYTVPITGLYDPLPHIKLKNYNLDYDNEFINFKQSLKDYLNTFHLNNTDAYINATSPSKIKECPYNPYINHGIDNLTGNCINNGYYHESSDGSCIFCRMEGKGNCSHYGLETFIVCHVLKNSSITSSDHVIFGDNPYPGDAINFNNSDFIYLDSGHKDKYGITW